MLVGCLCVMLAVVGCGTKGPWDKYVKLGEYKGLEITKQSTELTEEELQSTIDQVIQQNTTYNQLKEGTVKDGDTVNIDYEGKKDGVAFDGGTAKDSPLTIGSNQFIDGFEKGLIGVKVGETVDLDLKFPDPYNGNPELSGQDVVFTVTVNSIQGDMIVPEFNDEFVQGISDFKTVAEYKADMETNLKKSKEDQVVNGQKNELLDKVLSNSKIESYPEDQVKQYGENIKKELQSQADMYQTTLENLVQVMFGMDTAAFEKELDSAAREGVARNMVMDMIAAKENIKLDDKEYDEKSLDYVKSAQYESVEAYEEIYGKDTVRANLVRSKTLDYLLESAKQVDELTQTAAPENNSEAPTEEPAK